MISEVRLHTGNRSDGMRATAPLSMTTYLLSDRYATRSRITQ